MPCRNAPQLFCHPELAFQHFSEELTMEFIISVVIVNQLRRLSQKAALGSIFAMRSSLAIVTNRRNRLAGLSLNTLSRLAAMRSSISSKSSSIMTGGDSHSWSSFWSKIVLSRSVRYYRLHWRK